MTTRPLSLCLSLCCALAFISASSPSLGQAPSSANTPWGGDPDRFLKEAAKVNGLSEVGDYPWHLRVSFQSFDEQGGVNDQGTFEEFYVTPTKYKRIYSRPGFSWIQYGTEQGLLQTGNDGWASFVPGYLRTLIDPFRDTKEIAQFDLASEERVEAAFPYPCISLRNKSRDSRSLPEKFEAYCFEPGTKALRMEVDDRTLTALLYSRPLMFQGRSVPRDFEVVHFGKLIFTAHVETIETITTADEAALTPPPNAIRIQSRMVLSDGSIAMAPLVHPLSPGARVSTVNVSASVADGLLINRVDPVYPPAARAAGIQGNVVVEATITKEGRVSSIHVISGPPRLQSAAIDAVRQWTYRPFLLNGQAVEVRTDIEVGFSL
jgi:TonB family protein